MKKAVEILSKKNGFLEEIRNHTYRADDIWLDAIKKLGSYYQSYSSLPSGVKMHTDRFIFPAAAIYLAMKDADLPDAFAIMEKVMKEKSSAMGEQLQKASKVHGFGRFFCSMWRPVSHMMFGKSSGFQNIFYPKAPHEFKMDITACPYNKYLTELGCPELTQLFCKNDEYSYGNINGVKFIRTQTLGTGGDKCDFKIQY